MRKMPRELRDPRYGNLAARLILPVVVLLTLAYAAGAQDLGSLSLQVTGGTVEEKRKALETLRNLQSETASRAAVPALKDPNEIVRATAAFSVIFLPVEEAFRVLFPNLSDKAEIVRRETAYALGEVGNPAAVGMLADMSNKDKSAEARNAAIVALGRIGNAEGVIPLTKILGERPNADNAFRRRSAARSLGQIARNYRKGTTQVVTPENFLPEKLKEVAPGTEGNIAAAYPDFRGALNALLKVMQNPKEADDARREAAFALGEIGDPSAEPVLRANLGSKDVYLAEIARESLLKIAAANK